MDLGDLYKLANDDYVKDKKFNEPGDEDLNDEDDLSQYNRGGERLPALENCVENDGYKAAINEPLYFFDQMKPKYGQKLIEDMVRIGTPEYEFYIKQVEDIAEQKSGNHYICLHCWRYLNFH